MFDEYVDLVKTQALVNMWTTTNSTPTNPTNMMGQEPIMKRHVVDYTSINRFSCNLKYM